MGLLQGNRPSAFGPGAHRIYHRVSAGQPYYMSRILILVLPERHIVPTAYYYRRLTWNPGWQAGTAGERDGRSSNARGSTIPFPRARPVIERLTVAAATQHASG
jgi:hypothetical protein